MSEEPELPITPPTTPDPGEPDPLPPPADPPPPLPAQQAQVEIVSRQVVATGFFPAGSADASIEIVDLDEEAWAEFQAAPPGQKYLAEDGTLTVVPPPPPPIRKTGVTTVNQEVRTTDDVPLEVFRFPSSPKHVYKAVFEMMAIDAESGATRNTEAKMTFKRTQAALLQVGTTAIPYNAPDPATTAWAIVPTVDGTDLVISVKGAAGRAVDWALTGTVGAFAPEGLEA
jgi:hypothetical protein